MQATKGLRAREQSISINSAENPEFWRASGSWNIETLPSKAQQSAQWQIPSVSCDFHNRAVDHPLTKFVGFFLFVVDANK